MLYFSKLKLFIIYFIIIFLSFFFFSNFTNVQEKSFFSKKVNLGLDLQGGSYLLLEVDSTPIINQNLQQKVINLRKFFKENKFKYENLKLVDQSINFSLFNEDIERFEKIFLDQKNPINSYYGKYRSYEMNHLIEGNQVKIEYSKYGIVELKIASLDQSLEIVRRRVDEVGTNEPTIIKRGNDRILIELPGLEDPNRIKKLLGKTANLSFRLVSDNEDAFGSEVLSYENNDDQLNEGNWEYLLNSSDSWTNLDLEEGGNYSLLLGQNDLIRYVPDSGTSGSRELTFRIWDQFNGEIGTYINLLENSGISDSSNEDISTHLEIIEGPPIAGFGNAFKFDGDGDYIEIHF